MNRLLHENGAPRLLRIPSLDDPNRLLSLKEVARKLGIAKRTLYRWIPEKGLPVIRLSPRTFRVDPQALEAWLKSQEGPAAG